MLGIGLNSCRPKVKEKPIADFSPDKRQFTVGDTVRFKNLSKNFDKISWDFGDGSYSTELNPIHIYNKKGIFNPMIKAAKGNQADSMDLKIVIEASTEPIVRRDSIVAGKEAPAKKDTVKKSPVIVIWPVIAYTGDVIGYSTKAINPVVWDFGGKSTSESTIGQVSFAEVGQYVVKLIDKASGKVFDTKTIKILEQVDDNKFSKWLTSLANKTVSGTEEKEQRDLSIKVCSYCLNNGEIPIGGKETGSFKDFVRKIVIESNPYELVSITVKIQLNPNKKISSVQLVTYDKKTVNN